MKASRDRFAASGFRRVTNSDWAVSALHNLTRFEVAMKEANTSGRIASAGPSRHNASATSTEKYDATTCPLIFDDQPSSPSIETNAYSERSSSPTGVVRFARGCFWD